MQKLKNKLWGNSTGTPRQKSINKNAKRLKTSDADKSHINGINNDDIDDEELLALKQVCLSYIDMIEFVIDSIPDKKENESEPDFEPIFLQLKTFVTSAKRQLGRQEIDNHNKEERTLKLNAKEIKDLPDLPMEEPPTPTAHLTTVSLSSPELHALDAPGIHHVASLSATSLISDTSIISGGSHQHQSTMSRLRKFTSRTSGVHDDESILSSKSERDRIKTEIKVMRKQLKTRKFELLPNNIWDNYLLLYLCRSEQFILSSTCKYCMNKCGIQSFQFEKQFEFDNIYWRNNFFNFIDNEQDATLLINENKFELMTSTQKRQLKYYIKFWDKFIIQRQHRKQQRNNYYHDINDDENKENKSNYNEESKLNDNNNNNNNNDNNDDNDNDDNDDKKEEKKQKQKEEEELKKEDDKKDKKDKIIDIELEIEEEEKDKDKNKNKNKKEEESKDDIDEEEEEDLYASDNFEYDDDRPRGQVLLEKYRLDFEGTDNLQEDALLHIAIPCDVEQLCIRDCKNKNGELAHWLSSIFCYIPNYCPIDWFGLENNNFYDRDIHRICAGLLNRKTQSNLIGLSLCNNTNITDKCIAVLLKTISKKCHKLQFLRLSGCTKLTNKTCQYILDFYSKTYNDDKIQLNYIDLSNNYRINDKGIIILNQIYLHQQYTPFNVVIRFYVAGTQWKDVMDDWSKNIVLKPPKRR